MFGVQDVKSGVEGVGCRSWGLGPPLTPKPEPYTQNQGGGCIKPNTRTPTPKQGGGVPLELLRLNNHRSDTLFSSTVKPNTSTATPQ